LAGVPGEIIVIGAALDLALLVLGWMGAGRLWRRVTRRTSSQPEPLLELAPEKLLAKLEDENRELDRKLAVLRAEDADMPRFLGFPAG
jgi:hypothetical protein